MMESTRHVELVQATAQDALPTFADASVDLILADLPYGKTRNAWDLPFDLPWLWGELNRVATPSAAMVFFAQGTFAVDLIVSNRKNFRYDLVWEKDRPSGFLNARRMPMRSHEYLLIFYRKLPTYNPQMTDGAPSHARGHLLGDVASKNYGRYEEQDNTAGSTAKMPRSVLRFPRPHPMIHPTQKPVGLCEWVIRTYTNPSQTVLDPCCGSGTTLLAATQSDRRAIGVEPNDAYFDMAQQRLGMEKAA